ncbi:hypothetical protein ACFL0M_13015 [Thermodesulfobacteriota bacterium]
MSKSILRIVLASEPTEITGAATSSLNTFLISGSPSGYSTGMLGAAHYD